MAAKKAKVQDGSTLFAIPEVVRVAPEYVDRTADTEPAPGLAYVPPAVEDDVLLQELEDGRYIISILRHYGTTSCAVVYTEPQLRRLQALINEELA